jgi:hypothetical protein
VLDSIAVCALTSRILEQEGLGFGIGLHILWVGNTIKTKATLYFVEQFSYNLPSATLASVEVRNKDDFKKLATDRRHAAVFIKSDKNI